MTSALDILNRYPVLRSLSLLRPDVGGASPQPTESEAGLFLLWAAVFGRKDFHGIVIDSDYFAYITSPIGDYLSRLELYASGIRKDARAMTFKTIDECHLWYYGVAVPDMNLEMFVTPRELNALARHKHAGASLLDQLRQPPAPKPSPGRGRSKRNEESPADKPAPPWLETAPPSRNATLLPGVNLFGYADGIFGIGEDIRAVARSLRHASMPFSIYNVALPDRFATSEAQNLSCYFVDRPLYPVNLFCMTPFETELLRFTRGPNVFEGRYNIGYWPWELSSIPDYWRHVFDNIDEIWAISPYLADVFSNLTDKPVHYVPHHVNVSSVDECDLSEFGLAPADFVFLTMFDFNSYVARKNPLGAIEAFRKAFRKDGGERLLIKTLNGHLHADALQALVDQMDSDPRIVIVDGSLPRARTVGLIAAADCFLSLHRAEGFGRVVAEAMLLETPVIATDWSGSTSLLDDSTGFPVAYTLVDVRKGDYLYEEGSQWAEPSVEDAVEKLRLVRAKTDLVQRKVAAARKLVARNHGLEAVAKRLVERLKPLGRRS